MAFNPAQRKAFFEKLKQKQGLNPAVPTHSTIITKNVSTTPPAAPKIAPLPKEPEMNFNKPMKFGKLRKKIGY